MKALSVIELAKLYGMNRQSIYKRISKGDLSKNSDGKIDLAEAIRVFGEPSQRVTAVQSQATSKETESYILEQQVDFLKKQLELAQEREAFQREQLQAKDDQIESLQRLLGAPKHQQQVDELIDEKVSQLDENGARDDLRTTNMGVHLMSETVTKANMDHFQDDIPTKKRHRGVFERILRAVLD